MKGIAIKGINKIKFLYFKTDFKCLKSYEIEDKIDFILVKRDLSNNKHNSALCLKCFEFI